MKKVLIVLLFMAVSFSVQADDGWYASVGGGVMKVYGIKPSRFEQNVIGIPGVTSSSEVKERTTYKSVALGRCFSDYWCLEGGYLWDGHFNTSLKVSNLNPLGTPVFSGIPVNLGALPTSLTLQREADVSAVQLSVIGKVPTSDWFELFGRFGAYGYRLKTTAKILVPGQTIFLAEESTTKGFAPVASVGFTARTSKFFKLRFEGQKTGPVSIVSLAFVYQR